jgi:polysaccharide biosynthesis/export protein
MNRGRQVLANTFLTLLGFSLAHSAVGQVIVRTNASDTGQSTATKQMPPNAPDENGSTIHSRNWRYTVHPSDMLQLGFMLSPEFNQTVTVQPDGYITLLYVGDVSAAGRSLPELTEAIKTAYSKILHDPVISVAPTDFEKPYFVVGGQVGKPGKFDWRGDITVTQAVALAGGFTDASKHSQVLLFRRASDQWTQARIINVKQMLNSRNLQEDPVLQPGDMLFVPRNTLSKIKPFLPTSSVGTYVGPGVF